MHLHEPRCTSTSTTNAALFGVTSCEAWTLDTDGYFPADLHSDPLERQHASAETSENRTNKNMMLRESRTEITHIGRRHLSANVEDVA